MNNMTVFLSKGKKYVPVCVEKMVYNDMHQTIVIISVLWPPKLSENCCFKTPSVTAATGN